MCFLFWISIQYSLDAHGSAYKTHVSGCMFWQDVTTNTFHLTWYVYSSENTHFMYDLVYNLHDDLSDRVFEKYFEMTTLSHCVSVT